MPSLQMCLDDAQVYLERIIESLHNLNRPEKGPLIAVLDHLLRYVKSTKKDIAALRSAEGSGTSFSTAAEELQEIVREASDATHAIMNAAEVIEEVSRGLDKPAADALSNAVTSIYEACAFQDITGQRISKVIATLQGIESKVVGLARAIGGEVETTAIDSVNGRESDLLNGPQIGSQAKSQDEIDRLFESTS